MREAREKEKPAPTPIQRHAINSLLVNQLLRASIKNGTSALLLSARLRPTLGTAQRNKKVNPTDLYRQAIKRTFAILYGLSPEEVESDWKSRNRGF